VKAAVAVAVVAIAAAVAAVVVTAAAEAVAVAAGANTAGKPSIRFLRSDFQGAEFERVPRRFVWLDRLPAGLVPPELPPTTPH
jgi:hypothetical protein